VRSHRPPLDVSPAKRLAPFLLLGALSLLAGAGVATWGVLTGDELAWWTGLHVGLAGGVSLLIIGAAQFFACAMLATAPQSLRLGALQAVSWTGGVVVVVASRVLGEPWLIEAGIVLAGVALVLFTAGLRAMERRSLQRARWAVRWYYACAGFAAGGGLLGGELARGAGWAPGDLRTAHVVLMLLGWCGTAIVGTLHTLLPTMAQRPLAWPSLERPTFLAWAAGVPLLAADCLLGAAPVAVLGAMAVHTSALVLLANVARTAGLRPRGLPVRLLVLGQCSLAACTALLIAAAPTLVGSPNGSQPWREVVTACAVGWIVMTVLGSLMHLRTIVLRALRPVAA
jgi:hypothetical protein